MQCKMQQLILVVSQMMEQVQSKLEMSSWIIVQELFWGLWEDVIMLLTRTTMHLIQSAHQAQPLSRFQPMVLLQTKGLWEVPACCLTTLQISLAVSQLCTQIAVLGTFQLIGPINCFVTKELMSKGTWRKWAIKLKIMILKVCQWEEVLKYLSPNTPMVSKLQPIMGHTKSAI